MKLKLSGLVSVAVFVAMLAGFFALPVQPVQASTEAVTIPSIHVLSAIKNNLVTVYITGLPEDLDFLVREDVAGTQAISGNVVAGFNSGNSGSIVGTFEIDSALVDVPYIDLRIDSNGSYSAYVTFQNSDIPVPVVTTTSISKGGVAVVPVNVVPDSLVTVRVSGLPADEDFTVLEGENGSQGFGGHRIAGFYSGEGGTHTMAFEIDTDLRGLEKIDLRIVNAAGELVAYATFANQ